LKFYFEWRPLEKKEGRGKNKGGKGRGRGGVEEYYLVFNSFFQGWAECGAREGGEKKKGIPIPLTSIFILVRRGKRRGGGKISLIPLSQGFLGGVGEGGVFTLRFFMEGGGKKGKK